MMASWWINIKESACNVELEGIDSILESEKNSLQKEMPPPVGNSHQTCRGTSRPQ